MPVLLKIAKGPGEGQILTIPDGQTITLGRGTDASYMLPDPLLSREHCAIRCTETGGSIVDLKSLNGTFLNGKRLAEPQPIKEGDRIRLGSVGIEVLRIEVSSGAPLAAPASPSRGESGRVPPPTPPPPPPLPGEPAGARHPRVAEPVGGGTIVLDRPPVFPTPAPARPFVPGSTIVLPGPPVFPTPSPLPSTPAADDASPGHTIVLTAPPVFPTPAVPGTPVADATPPPSPLDAAAPGGTIILSGPPVFPPPPPAVPAPARGPAVVRPRRATPAMGDARACEACGAPLAPAEERTMCPSCFDRFDVEENLLEGFRILERVFRTPTGEVFKAEQPLLGRTVFVKTLTTTGWQQDEKTLRRFMREAKAAARLTHPSIVEFYDVNEQGDHIFIVMEYVDGPTLEELVEKDGPLAPRTAMRYMAQIADALAFVHQNKVVHRDVRPGTIMIAKGDDRAKLADFTLARNVEIAAFGEITASGDTLSGVPWFESPEQVRDARAADYRSDIYSFGGTFFYALTGTRPIPGKTYVEFLQHIMKEGAPPVERLAPSLPTALAAIVNRTLARDPAARFRTMEELQDALEPFIRALGGEL